MLLEHEGNYGLGMDAMVTVFSWNTKEIMGHLRCTLGSLAACDYEERSPLTSLRDELQDDVLQIPTEGGDYACPSGDTTSQHTFPATLPTALHRQLSPDCSSTTTCDARPTSPLA